MVTEFTLFYVAFNFFFNATAGFPNGQQNPAAYPRYGLVMGLVMGVFMVACVAALFPMVRRMRTGWRLSASFRKPPEARSPPPLRPDLTP